MQEKINDLRKAIRCECWFSALALALTFPDICGKVEFERDGYSQWFDKYIAEKYYSNFNESGVIFKGIDCYKLRCAFLHAGNLNLQERDKKSEIDRFELSVTPLSQNGYIVESHGKIIDENERIIEKRVRLDICKLCEAIYKETDKFYKENKEKFQVKYANKEKQAVVINLTK